MLVSPLFNNGGYTVYCSMLRILLVIFCSLLPVWLPAAVLSGRITNAQGEGIPYAAILFTPGNFATLSNVDGKFSQQLAPGNYTMQIHCLGYQAKRLTLVVDENDQQTNIQLDAQVYELAEVKVKAKNEDPAYDIMRQAIARAPLYRNQLSAYSAKSYVKGTMVVTKAPWLVRKLMEQENIKTNTTYLLESVSQLEYRQPGKFSEKVLSMRSNLPPSLANNSSISYGAFNFYQETVAGQSSPLAPTAFASYRFTHRGSRQEGAYRIHKIEVNPRRDGQGVVSGYLYLVDGSWNIYSLEFNYRDNNGNPYTFSQQYQPIDSLWVATKQDIQITFGYMGALANFRYVSSVRDHRLTPNAAIMAQIRQPIQHAAADNNREASRLAKVRKKELESAARDSLPADRPQWDYRYEIDTLARRQPDSLWNEMRQIPLETTEVEGYRLADSLYEKSREAQARSDSAPNRFGWLDPLLSYRYRKGSRMANGQYPLRWNYYGPVTGILPYADFYNAVEGFALQIGLERIQSSEDNKRHTSNFQLRYALAARRWQFKLSHQYQNQYKLFRLSAGSWYQTLDPNQMLAPWLNTVYTLIDQQHLRPLYLNSFVAFELRQQMAVKWQLQLQADVAYRQSDVVRNTHGFFPDLSVLNSNAPIVLGYGPAVFPDHFVYKINYRFNWQPGAVRGLYNGEERIANRRAITWSFIGESGYADGFFQKLSVEVAQNKDFGKGRSLAYQLTAGHFLVAPRFIQDFQHFAGNQTLLMGSDPFQFRALPYYALSSKASFVSAMSTYSTRRLLLTHWAWIRHQGIDEKLFANTMLNSQGQYVEFGYRIDRIAAFAGLDLFVAKQSAQSPWLGARLKLGFR